MMLDPITAQLIGSALVYACEEMGIAIRDAAYSPNIKERLDHSCALFDARGRLIAQAEHIPVHLGSLPWGLRRTVAWLTERGRTPAAGEMIVVNDPYICGTHLNDVTVVRPMYAHETLVGYAVNKAHHTDVGGAVPGSMPPDAADLFAAGSIVPPMVLVRDDRPVAETVELLRANSRTPHARAGDLRAQIAGNFVGERRFLEVVERYGTDVVTRALDQALDDAERRTRAALRDFPDGVVNHHDVLEDERGEPSIVLRVRLEKRGDTLSLDYEGTAPQQRLPLNAVYGVTLSGVYYAVRAVTDPYIPTNDGSFRPVHVRVPEGTLLNPRRPAAVGAGNVETSMRNADLVLGALARLAPERLPAQSGGSMNNVLLGGTDETGRTWAFYETNGCGMGARPHADGIDGVHVHMTNTLNTPIEALERELPLLVTRYEFAAGSGGGGRYRGGAGIVRAFALRAGNAVASLLADRHTVAPRGGEAGGCGAHTLRHNGITSRLAAKTTLPLEQGDEITISTAGGGGYGHAGKPASEQLRHRSNNRKPALLEQRPARSLPQPANTITHVMKERVPVANTDLRARRLRPRRSLVVEPRERAARRARHPDRRGGAPQLRRDRRRPRRPLRRRRRHLRGDRGGHHPFLSQPSAFADLLVGQIQ
ncbi:MAG: hydantoinase B/oxoprolinase family protein [Candidatus Eremiobacteraeota bacterium]|nr:hydantoinase B/oxoprolinase family protein [Candidatus Eremiobacteraeota bacterium]